MGMERSQHFQDMLKERNIAEEWVERCEKNPEKKTVKTERVILLNRLPSSVIDGLE